MKIPINDLRIGGAGQRYCRRLSRYRNTLRVSADLAATAAALNRENPGVLDLQRPRPRERRTLRWRGPDSNHRSRESAGCRRSRDMRVLTTAMRGPPGGSAR